MRLRTRALILPLIAALAVAPALPARAETGDVGKATSTMAWLARQSSPSHGMLESFPGSPDPGLTLDGVLAGIATQAPGNTVKAWLKAVEPTFADRVLENADAGIQQDNGMIGKALVALSASRSSTTSYDGVNPRKLAEQSFSGSGEAGWSKGTNAFGQGYVMIGLARTGALPASTVTFLAGKQCADGGFPMNFTAGKGCTVASDPDGTAVVVMALRAAKAKGIKAADTPLNKAVNYLVGKQRPNGSFTGHEVYTPAENANTTGLVAAALADLKPAVVTKARAWMTTMQVASGTDAGAVAYDAQDKKAGIDKLSRPTWVRATTQGLLAFAPIDFYRLGRPFGVYTTPGYHTVSGRNWHTTCEKYSATERCTTRIEATTVTQAADGSFRAVKGWTFNNLTYLPSPRNLWAKNPLGGFGKVGYTGQWTSKEGRSWRVECDTAVSGRGGCRSYIYGSFIANVAKPGQPVRYAWTKGWVFNNIVQFS